MENSLEASNVYPIARNSEELDEAADVTYLSAVQEVSGSIKDLMQSEISLFKAEISKSLPEFQKNSSQLIMSSGLYALGLLPFVAFMVLGLGEFLDGRYWLSSLIVSVVFFAIAIPLRARALKKLKGTNYLAKTIENLDRSLDSIKYQFEKIMLAAKGDRHDSY